MTGGSSGGGGGPGAGSGGTGGDTGSSGSGGSGGGTACAGPEDCPTGGFCNPMTSVCSCPADKQNICDNTCTNTMEDPAFCGDCAIACDPGAACSLGVCGPPPVDVATASATCGVIRMVVAGTDLYWTEAGTGLVRSVPLAGGAVTDVATAQIVPVSIAADAGGIYWSNLGNGTAGTATVMKKALPIVAGDPIVLATGVATDPDTPEILAIAVADSMLYYTLVHDVHAISTDEAITGDVVVGTATNVIPEGTPSGLAVSDTHVIWTTGGSRTAIEIDTILEGNDGYVELGDSQGSLVFADVAMDGTNGYWATAANFMKRPLDISSDVVQVTSTLESEPITAFTTDATNVYFAGEDGSVYKAPLAGGKAVHLLRDQAEPTSVVLSGTTLYVATSDCAIRSVPIQ